MSVRWSRTMLIRLMADAGKSRLTVSPTPTEKLLKELKALAPLTVPEEAEGYATAMRVLLYQRVTDREPQRVIDYNSDSDRWGDIWSIFVPGLKAGQLYHFQADGPFDPDRGHRFNHHKLLIDPYATAIDRPLAPFERAFDPPVLSRRVDALGGDGLIGFVEGSLGFRQLRLECAYARLDALQLRLQLVASSQQGRLAALGAGDALRVVTIGR